MLQRFVLLIIYFSFQVFCEILDPKSIQTIMFTQQISGVPKIIIPTQQFKDSKLIQQTYKITMQKTTQKMLPAGLPPTPLYVYSAMTASGKVSQFPGPAIIAKKGIPIKVIWVSNITGPHMLPVDYNQPFIDNDMFRKQVPVVPHAHGITTHIISDGEPGAYWTASGGKSQRYRTEQPCQKNQAVFIYPNQQDPGLFWYHDHAYGITRLNVYAGLAGLYQIIDNPQNKQLSFAQQNILNHYNENLTKLYFSIADKTFKTDGSLYYPNQSSSSQFTSWTPQFFGNTITVNGKVWPKLVLQKKKYRMIFLNACQCRYLNIYFLNANRKIPFELLRLQGDFFSTSIVVTQYLFSPGARVQLVLDLTQINGEVIMKNNAPAPYPMGDPANLVDNFTGIIMKIVMKINIQTNQNIQSKLPLNKIIKQQKVKPITIEPNFIKFIANTNKNINQNKQPKIKQLQTQKSIKIIQTKQLNLQKASIKLKQSLDYPAFPQGQKIFTTLSELEDTNMQIIGMFIDGVSMELGHNCQNSIYEVGKVYDIHVINLTPDAHPIHFHLVNMQFIYSYPIDTQQYTKDWYDANGGQPSKRGWTTIPIVLDPLSYQSGNRIFPKPYEKVFRDIIDCHAGSVTVVRIKFSHNNGDDFGFRVAGSRYVWHCHMLEHQDNEMMKYFCLK